MAFVGKLKPFQHEAYERMIDRERVLVAYDMGLGKTPITIAAIEHLFEKGEVECGLIVCGASLKYQWVEQIKRFSDCARIITIDGDPRQRERQYRRAIKLLGEYVVLSYDNFLRDFDWIEQIPIDFEVLDEATAIKGLKAKRSKAVKQVRPRVRYALTGQPIENRPEELFSIMQWVDPKVLGNFLEFERTFIVRYAGTGQARRYRNLRLLTKTMGDAMVRKTAEDEDVRDQMPAVVSENAYAEFDPAGAKLYRKIAAETLALLHSMPSGSNWNVFSHYGMNDNPEMMKARGDVMSRLTALRLLCNHPELLTLSAEAYEASLEGGAAKGSKYCYELRNRGWFDNLKKAPKMEAAVEQIVELLDAHPKNKIVLFSFNPSMLVRIANATGGFTKSVLFHGSMTAKQRDVARTQFLNDPSTRLFLSSDAGGYGVDLPNANYLINYDLPWSAGKLKQRNSRHRRTNSEWSHVTVINYMMVGSVEVRVHDVLQEKSKIASAWIDGKGITGKSGALELTLESLTTFLATSEV